MTCLRIDYSTNVSMIWFILNSSNYACTSPHAESNYGSRTVASLRLRVESARTPTWFVSDLTQSIESRGTPSRHGFPSEGVLHIAFGAPPFVSRRTRTATSGWSKATHSNRPAGGGDRRSVPPSRDANRNRSLALGLTYQYESLNGNLLGIRSPPFPDPRDGRGPTSRDSSRRRVRCYRKLQRYLARSA